jgi:hypothetical protein
MNRGIFMDPLEERQRNQVAFRQMKELLGRAYPAGRFVAISGGQVVADADRLDDLQSLVRQQGGDPRQVLMVQVGADYPETAVIFLKDMRA